MTAVTAILLPQEKEASPTKLPAVSTTCQGALTMAEEVNSVTTEGAVLTTAKTVAAPLTVAG